jgi:hypothetical protein
VLAEDEQRCATSAMPGIKTGGGGLGRAMVDLATL